MGLFAALNPATGKVIGKLSAMHRAVDFRDFLDETDRQSHPQETRRQLDGAGLSLRWPEAARDLQRVATSAPADTKPSPEGGRRLAPPAGLEPAAKRLEGACSIH